MLFDSISIIDMIVQYSSLLLQYHDDDRIPKCESKKERIRILVPGFLSRGYKKTKILLVPITVHSPQ